MNNLAILVLSCDKYSGLWDLFFHRMAKYWPDCPYPVYLLTNNKEYPQKDIRSLRVGDDIDWSSNLINGLNQIEEENILLLIEDAPFDKQVSQLLFQALYEKYQQANARYLNLKASPPPTQKNNNEFVEVERGALYRIALVPALWRKDTLLQLLVPGETAWQFEIQGSNRSDKFDGVYSVNKPFFSLLHCVIKGKIDPRAMSQLVKADEGFYVSTFNVMSIGEYAKLRLAELRATILKIFPKPAQRRIRTFYYEHFVGSNNVLK